MSLRPLLAVLALSIGATSFHALPSAEGQATSLLNAARLAIGFRPGGPTLRSMRIDATETTTQSVHTDTQAGVFRSRDHERRMIRRFIAPDRFIETTFVGPSEWRSGIDAGRPIQSRRMIEPGVDPWKVAEPWEGQTEFQRMNFALFALGMFARTDVIPGMRITPAGADGVRLDGGTGTYAVVGILTFDPRTHLPARLTRRLRMQIHPRNSVLGKITDGGGGGGPATSELPEVELVTTYRDHRTVAGFTVPFVITTTSGSTLLTEIRVNGVRIGEGVSDADFR
jgi:hypothetical protein